VALLNLPDLRDGGVNVLPPTLETTTEAKSDFQCG
jgi:hypothetical protein